MRPLRFAAVLVLVLAGLRVGAQPEPPTPTTLPPRPQTEFQTMVKGTLPDLAGRWLAISWLEIPGGRARTTAALWEIERGEGQPNLTMPFTHLPAEQEAAMEKASQADQRWEPSAEDVAQIAARWDQLEPGDSHVARLDNYLTGRDAFDATFTSEPRTRDAQWVLQQTETFDASAAPAVRQVNVYAVLEARDGGYRGNYTTTLLAAAPFPIPITLQGTFQMIRLEQRRQGVLTRLGDLFRGCGHR
jgi:hypothetical protein